MPLLKTYEYERRKYAQDLINFDKKFAKLFSGKPRTKECQDGVSHEEFLKAFQTFGEFTSGTGICYSESTITNQQYQGAAKNLTIGQRLLPQIFLRAADGRPVEIQDFVPSDSRFKILVFTGNSSDPTQLQKVQGMSQDLENVLSKLSTYRISLFFDLIAISSATKAAVRYNDLPKFLWSHWSKVLIDDKDVKGVQGGDGYKNYGVSPDGAIIVVRPDGYVGMVAPLDQVTEIEKYFSEFMQA